MSDDHRNMVWKGYYLGTQPVDVMMHVPVDRASCQTKTIRSEFSDPIIANPSPLPAILPRSRGWSMAAVALEVLPAKKSALELATLSDHFFALRFERATARKT